MAFLPLLFYWVVCKNKNSDVGWVLKWVGKVDKVVFEDAIFFLASPDANALVAYMQPLL